MADQNNTINDYNLLQLSTEIANKVQALPSVKSNHHSTLVNCINTVLNDWQVKKESWSREEMKEEFLLLGEYLQALTSDFPASYRIGRKDIKHYFNSKFR
jgi:hypothetical protein